jgi:hypothetical protein
VALKPLLLEQFAEVSVPLVTRIPLSVIRIAGRRAGQSVEDCTDATVTIVGVLIEVIIEQVAAGRIAGRGNRLTPKIRTWGTRPLVMSSASNFSYFKLGWLRFVVSHSSTIKLWMNGAQPFLVLFYDRGTCRL